MSDPLLRWREEFPILAGTNYLISNSLGAMPRSARASMERFAGLWDERGVRAWADEWWNVQFDVARDVAALLGVPGDSVSMHQNVAMASQSILSCFEFSGPRNKVVYTDMNFPSVMYLYESMADRGARIVRVPTEDGIGIDQQRLLDAIDEETLLVPVSHVLFRSAYIQDAQAIVAKAREVGAFVVLDVFQSVGILPLELQAWGVHAAVGGALKYCCGGPGNCFLYVDPDLRNDLVPHFTGWSAHTNPFAFSAEGQDYRTDGGRFLNGTPNVPALYAGREGVRIVKEVGLQAIREKSMLMTAMLIEEAERHGLRCNTPADPAVRGGHVPVDVPHGYEVCQVLLEEDIVVDYRPQAGIRMAPHFYNTEEEVVGAVRRMAEIVESREYERFVDAERRPG